MSKEHEKKGPAPLTELSEDSIHKVTTGQATGEMPTAMRGPGFGATPTAGAGPAKADDTNTNSVDEVKATKRKNDLAGLMGDDRERMLQEHAKEDAAEESAKLQAKVDATRMQARPPSGKTFWVGPGNLEHSGVVFHPGDDITMIGSAAISKLPADQIDRG